MQANFQYRCAGCSKPFVGSTFVCDSGKDILSTIAGITMPEALSVKDAEIWAKVPQTMMHDCENDETIFAVARIVGVLQI